jgi:hypothetical protein
MAIKQILFNTEMVRAILMGQKTCTRRVVKGFIPDDAVWGYTAFTPKGYISCRGTFPVGYGEKFFKLPYQKGDILYVRETWCRYGKLDDFDHVIEGTEEYYYLADGANPTPYNCFLVQRNGYDEYKDTPVWHPSIHMPKEAARIWLKVTDVRVERLQGIDGKGCVKEGIEEEPLKDVGEEFVKGMYHDLWDSTIKKSDIDRYGWDANPWVWVIDFERCDKPKEWDK